MNSESFLTIPLLKQVLDEFDWPLEFVLEDDMPDGIIMSFPNSHFEFMDREDGEIEVAFLPEDTKTDLQLETFDALQVFVLESERTGEPLAPGLTPIRSPFNSPQKTKDCIRNECILMQTYLMEVIHGDFSWVQRYLEMREQGLV